MPKPKSTPEPAPRVGRRTILAVLFFCEVTLVIGFPFAERTIWTRLAIVALWTGSIATILYLVWKWPRMRKFVLWIVGLAAIWTAATIWYGGFDVPTFVKELRQRENIPLVPDGETSRGLDGAGLVRVSLEEALLWRGRPGAALRLWFDDASARDLGNAYPEFFRFKGRYGNVANIDLTTVVTGSLAVTASGQHVMAYVGNGEWILASEDADPPRIVILTGTEPEAQFGQDVDLYEPRKD
jgi:hypothetical protein